VAKLVTPLRGRSAPVADDPPAAASPAVTAKRLMGSAAAFPQAPPARQPSPASKPSAKATRPPPKFTLPPAPRSATAAPYQAPPQTPVPAEGLERQALLALRRGRRGIEARLDLHGMVQTEAHAALTGFLLRARATGHTYVLVVTGKGGAGYSDPFGERGVLRRSVPHWLRGPELRSIVHGFEEAARHHGGGGALYVRLRRR
jgi:DNA-nicking Smr family endonuclease